MIPALPPIGRETVKPNLSLMEMHADLARAVAEGRIADAKRISAELDAVEARL